jgi:hypothetical protein
MVKRKKEKDRQYNDQKKRREEQTIQWSKEKKRRTDNTMVKRKEEKVCSDGFVYYVTLTIVSPLHVPMALCTV